MTNFIGIDILDGEGLRLDQTLRLEDGIITAIDPRQGEDQGEDLSQNGARALITPGLIDLQVNGGAGLMLANCQTTEDISRLAAAHRQGGTLGLLPTLISDTPETTTRIIDLVAKTAVQDPAVRGLHLEGPHLARAGVHPPDLLRPMTQSDLELYVAAAARLPHLLITLAPEYATPEQIAGLKAAGATIFLGHSDCDYDLAQAAFAAGATGTTHLFNAMSGLHHRAPGLVGAALDHASFIGLIADGHHVHPAALRLAMTNRPEAICLVSDAMAPTGTEMTDFTLGKAKITRQSGILTRADGTLAGADLTQAQAVRILAEVTKLPFRTCLKAAFDTPHRALTGAPNRLIIGQPAQLLHWQGETLIGPLGP